LANDDSSCDEQHNAVVGWNLLEQMNGVGALSNIAGIAKSSGRLERMAIVFADNFTATPTPRYEDYVGRANHGKFANRR